MATDTQGTLKQYVGDMLAVTKHIHEAIERQMDDERVQSDSNANTIIRKIDGVLESHIAGLESHLSRLGGSASSPIKDAVGAIAGVAAGLYDKVRGDTVSKMLRDDYTALSLAAIAQTMLHTTGLALKDDATASLALGQLKDITPLITDLSEVVPLVVAKELIDNGENVDTTVGEEAKKNTQKAWSRSNTESN